MTERRAAGGHWHDQLLLLGRFVRSPRTVGAIAPSSRRLAERLVEGLDWAAARRIAELGPGTGIVTGAIARRLASDARCLAVDRDPAFASRLDARWPRVECVADGAEALASLGEARGLLPFDHIVSGLPFASLPAATTGRILDAVHDTLRVGGTFTTFQYVHAFRFRSASAFREAMTGRMGAAPARRLVVGNLPPAVVLRWRRAS
jgi:phosphatidylethanolamine/phosphatidyl-N-methylethanolamine N-methyltransferase